MVIRAKDQASRVVTALQRNVAGEFAHIQRQSAIANKEVSLLADTIRGKYGAQILRQQKVLNGALVQGNATRAQGARQAIRDLKIMEAGELQHVAAIRRANQAQAIAIARQKELAVAAAAARRNVIRAVGAIAVVGTVIAAAVGAGIYGLFKLANATKAYNQQIAYTLTQVDKQKATVADLRRISDNVAATIAAPLEQLQPALYDIFSSMNVSVKQSGVLLRAFAKEAVAGQTSVQTAGRSTIGIMNAFHIPVSKVNEVLDFQFQLVRKGVGTFGDFARTIGRAVPSAVRAGQSYRTLGGMLAFLTRNGLSAAMAAASAGRALDAISNPKVVKRLADFGDVIAKASGISATKLRALGVDVGHTSVKVKDAHGNFRPMVDIMREFSQVLLKLPPVSRVAVLQELFKGAGGTIQARRFFDVVIKRFPEFNALIRDMGHASGATREAYGKMAGTVASRTELLKNRFKLLRNALSDALQPALQGVITWLLRGVDAGMAFSNWFKSTLVPAVKSGWVIFQKFLLPTLSTVAAAWRDNKKEIGEFATDAVKFLAVVIPAAILVLIHTFAILIKLIGFVARQWILFKKAVSFAYESMKLSTLSFARMSVVVWKFLMSAFFTFAKFLVDKAAVAFGWVPGVGPKLKRASRAFATMKDDSNRALQKIIDKTEAMQRTIQRTKGKKVTVTADVSVSIAKQTIAWLRTAHVKIPQLASGGRLPGFGGGDRIPALLEAGETVIDKSRSRQYAGVFKAMGVRGYQAGGLAGMQRIINADSEANRRYNRQGIDFYAGRLTVAIERLAKRLDQMAARSFMFGPPGALPPAGYLSGIRGSNQQIVRKIFADLFGWRSAAQWNATNQLVSHESGWNNNAQNPTSTAYGLFQFLNSTWASVGISKTSDPRLQAVAGGRYIRGRYHDPIGAWSFWQGHHWYDLGGIIREQIIGLGLRSGRMYGFGGSRPERVTPIRTGQSDGGGTVVNNYYNVAISAGNILGGQRAADDLARLVQQSLLRKKNVVGGGTRLGLT